MSIRFNNTNPNYLSTNNGPPSTQFSMSLFFNIASISAGTKNTLINITDTVGALGAHCHEILYGQDDTTNFNGHLTYKNPDNTVVMIFPNNSVNMKAWIFTAITMQTGKSTFYWKYVGSPNFNILSTLETFFTPAYTVIGSNAVGAQPMSGLISGVRIWNGYLTTEELQKESESLEPFRKADLWANWRLDNDKNLLSDTSSNILLTASNTSNISQGTNPPIPQYRNASSK